MRITRFLPAIGLALLVLLIGAPSLGQTPKSGGWLTLRLREDLPQGFAINESPTISTMWPAMPCFSNLVLFERQDARPGLAIARRSSSMENGFRRTVAPTAVRKGVCSWSSACAVMKIIRNPGPGYRLWISR